MEKAAVLQEFFGYCLYPKILFPAVLFQIGQGRNGKAWRTARNAAGLVDFHFHDLRHTFCSNLLLSGSDLKDVKEMIGHSDLSMTDRYSHLTNSHKRIQQNKLAEHYANGIHQSG